MKTINTEGWNTLIQEGNSNAGVVLVHEIFGLMDYIKSVADELSKEGFWVGAVDLFRGKQASSLEEGFKLRGSLTEKEILDGLESSLNKLKDEIGRKAVKIGSMGFCMGGAFALLGACHLEFSFCVDYYGMIEDVNHVREVKGPIQLILGSEDERITPWAIQTLLPSVVKYRKRVDVHLYPNVGHAFHNPNWGRHNAEASKDAWSKTISFLSQFK